MFDNAYAEPHPMIDEGRREMAALLANGGALMATTTMTMAKALNEGLRRAMERDPKVLLMGEDIGKLGGVFRITDGLQKDFGQDRVIDTPLAESAIVGTAVGLAIRGYRCGVRDAVRRLRRSRPSTRSSVRWPNYTSAPTASTTWRW